MNELYQKVRRIQIRTARRISEGFVGAYTAAFRGQGIEFEEVREYQPGDDVRSIDWNVTARTGVPHIKNFRQERELTVHLVVDASASLLFGSKPKRESVAELAALLAASAIANGDRVGLLLFTDQIELYLPPRRGTPHLLRIVAELLGRPIRGRGTDMALPFDFLSKVHRRRGITFCCSDFLCPIPEASLARHQRRCELVGLRLTDPLERQFPKAGLLRLRDLETGATQIVDTAKLSSAPPLTSFGDALLDLSTESDPLPLLNRFFRGRRCC